MKHALLLLFVLPLLGWHHLLTTIAEVSFNADSGYLEVALHCTPRDLEATLSKDLKRLIRLDQEKNLDPLLEDYCNRHFQLLDAEGKQVPLLWVGKEIELRDAWLYFQLDVDGKWQDKTLYNDVLANLHHKYMNTVRLQLGNHKPRSLSFDAKHPQRALSPDLSGQNPSFSRQFSAILGE